MWSNNDGPFEGKRYQLAETINSPQPLHPVPIMIGGAGEKTLRLVARYGDATNLFTNPDTGPDQVRAKLDVLAAHCQREGTDYDRIRKTVLWAAPVAAEAEGAKRLADQLAAYARIGIEEVHVMPWTGDPVGFIEGLGENVIGRIADR
jgi:alkanesulfonate monooxygenase SsuD/methylene tetrahydromethanopterin reductase-like flavin-dependent oxidoreductase (luciferase family)